MITNVVIPVLLIAVLAIVVPRGLERAMPETLGGVLLLGTASALAMTVLSAVIFAAAYHTHGAALPQVFGLAPGATARHFLWLGVKSALIWAPLTVLAVSSWPRRWRTATW